MGLTSELMKAVEENSEESSQELWSKEKLGSSGNSDAVVVVAAVVAAAAEEGRIGVAFIDCDDDDDELFVVSWFCELEHLVGVFLLRLLNLTEFSDDRDRSFLPAVADGAISGDGSGCEVMGEPAALSVIRKVFLSSSMPSCAVGDFDLARMCFHDEWLLASM